MSLPALGSWLRGLMVSEPVSDARVARRSRLVLILDACREAGLEPVPGAVVHGLAYLSDALSPIWGLDQLEGQLLKRRSRPFFPALQAELDWLVWSGAANVTKCSYLQDESGAWSIDANYVVDRVVASRVVTKIREFREQDRLHRFVREVVFAASMLDDDALSNIGLVDVAYASRMVDQGGLLDLDGSELNSSAKLALEFSDVMAKPNQVSRPELTHLYVRYLTSLVGR